LEGRWRWGRRKREGEKIRVEKGSVSKAKVK